MSFRGLKEMIVIEWIIEIFFFTICGWVGHIAVKVVTFGKVNLEWGDSSESVVTEYVGVGVLIAIAMLVLIVIGCI